jgi:hypothetical protein
VSQPASKVDGGVVKALFHGVSQARCASSTPARYRGQLLPDGFLCFAVLLGWPAACTQRALQAKSLGGCLDPAVRAVGTANASSRRAVELFLRQGRTYSEIGNELGCSEDAAWKIYHRGVAELWKAITDHSQTT